MFKVVYDTNVVVSGLLSSRGIPALLLDLVFNGRVVLFLSPDVFEEYEQVLARPRFAIQAARRESVLCQLRSLSRWVEPRQHLAVAGDPDDNRFLECALAGRRFSRYRQSQTFPQNVARHSSCESEAIFRNLLAIGRFGVAFNVFLDSLASPSPFSSPARVACPSVFIPPRKRRV